MRRKINLDNLANRYISSKKKLDDLEKKVVKKITQNEDLEKFVELVSGYHIKIDAFKVCLNAFSDEMLEFILGKTNDFEIALRCVKFFGNEEKLSKYNFEKFNGLQKENLVKNAEMLCRAMRKKIIFHPYLKLLKGGKNKFIFGINEKSDDIHMAWSSVETHKYHKEIFNAIDEKRTSFPIELRSGGYVDFSTKNIVFLSRSGDFGCYNHKVIRRFAREIEEELSRQCGEKIKIKINVSE